MKTKKILHSTVRNNLVYGFTYLVLPDMDCYIPILYSKDIIKVCPELSNDQLLKELEEVLCVEVDKMKRYIYKDIYKEPNGNYVVSLALNSDF